eukprot:m.544703 g.544703  ORF g.544703 m.544703 type:complete len:479 (-) comp22141_c0_seq1:607-2043(-)
MIAKMLSTLLGYCRGSALICDFFVRNIWMLKDLPSPESIAALVASRKPNFEIVVPESLPRAYNRKFEVLRAGVVQCLPRTRRNFSTSVSWFFLVRLFCIFIAALDFSFVGHELIQDTTSTPSASGDRVATYVLAASALQFVILPYSFHVSLLHLLVLAIPLYVPHYVAVMALDAVVPAWAAVSYTLTTPFACAFVVADLLVCWLLCSVTPKGVTVQRDNATLATHMAYGFLNCKTYSILVLLLARGHSVNVTVWVLDAMLGVSARVADATSRLLLTWGTIFYHQHRLAHLPTVYEEAHKFHHYLHDTTPFDAHVYGAGAPEEWFSMVLEVVGLTRYGLPPPLLSYGIIRQSIASKIGHTRSVFAAGGINHHADHHTLHRKNFGFGSTVLVDMLFGTNSNNNVYELGPYTVTKCTRGTGCANDAASPSDASSQPVVVFSFSLTNRNEHEKSDIEARLKDYYNPSLLSCLQLAVKQFFSA